MAYPNETPTTGGQSEYGVPAAPSAASAQTGPAGWDQSSVQSPSERAKETAFRTGEEVKEVAATAQEAGGHVVETAKQEAGEVIEEAKVQGRRLLDESMYEFRAQASTGQQKVAELARSLGGELGSMAEADRDGMLSGYVDRAQRLSEDAAAWLESSRPDEVLDSVRRYAARNPWQFLAISAGVGFVGSRIYRGLHDAKADRAEPVHRRGVVQPDPTSHPTPLLPDTYAGGGAASGSQLPTPSGAPPRGEAAVGIGGAEPESRYEGLTVEGVDPWREGQR